MSCVIIITITRTEELGEDDISFKMINENATLVRSVLTTGVVMQTMLGARTIGLGQEAQEVVMTTLLHIVIMVYINTHHKGNFSE